MAGMSSGPGPQRPSAQVYRRRRIVVLIAALVVVILVIWGLVAGVRAVTGGGDPDDGAGSATGSAAASADAGTGSGDATGGDASGSASAKASDGASPAGVNPDGSCPHGAIEVTASTDQKSYASGQKPVLILTLRNKLTEACTADVGTKQQKFTITSGSDRIFSTSDCQEDAESTELSLEPGKKEQARFTWDRTRSLPKCADIATKPRTGTYTLKVALGKTTSDPVQFVLK